MHELGIVYEIVDIVKEVVDEQHLKQVEAVVLNVGEASSVVPYYLRECWPAAVDNTPFEKTRLDIRTIEARAVCLSCDHVYAVKQSSRKCPKCGSTLFDIVSGTEFFIQEIVAC